MKIIEKRIYTGKNIYSHKLCIRLTVDVEELYDTPTKAIEGFNERLVNALPGLKKHCCSLGYEGGFSDRLHEGTYLPHVFEHTLIEMQNILGFKNVKYGKARCVKDNIYHVIYQYELEEAALLCAEYGIACFNNFIVGKDYEMKNALLDIERKIVNIRLGPSTSEIYNEAKKRGIPVLRIGNESVLQLGYGKYQKRIEATLTENTSCVAVDISCDKSLTREVLSAAGLPVAKGGCAGNINEMLALCREVGYPIVIKPLKGNQGKGVTVNIKCDEEAIKAYTIASKVDKRILIEKYIGGKDYRVLVVNKKIAAVSLRMPPSVLGNGKDSINQLIEKENEDPLRGYDHEKPLTKITVDDIMINYLNNKGISLDYIPENGERVVLRFNANLSTGGVAKDYTDNIHPDNMEIAIRAAEAVGLDIAGIDICTNDISKSIHEENGVIIEVNAAPGIRMHTHPSIGKGKNVSASIIDYLFQEKDKYSIPVVSVTGTNGKTTTTRMIAHILSLSGKNVGMTTTSGIYINNKCIIKGDTTGPDSAKTILMDKKVEAAVLETARGGILRRGLGYDMADVGVITNVSSDHIGIDGLNTIDEIADTKALVIEAVKEDGYAVLNADDEFVNFFISKAKCNIIFFSKNVDNIILKRHLLDGGKAMYLNNNFICFAEGEVVEPIINIADMPSSIEGKLIFNVENAMAAAGACIALKEDIGTIVKGLKSFILDESQNPGRFNVYNVDNFKVVVDYGHNIGAYNKVLKSLQLFEAKRLVGIIGIPGDRRNDDIIECAKACGEVFDYLYIKEDVDKRGRKLQEVIKLQEKGVILAGKCSSDYELIINEGDALEKAMNNAKEGDCIVVFYEDYNTIMNAINDFKAKTFANEHNYKAI